MFEMGMFHTYRQTHAFLCVHEGINSVWVKKFEMTSQGVTQSIQVKC